MRTNRLALLALALTALEASTSERHDQIELSDLVRQSSLIALVEPASPPTKKTEIAIGPKGGSKETYPPFTRVQQRYVVKAVLKNEAGKKLAEGALIEVDVGDFDTRLTVHRRYYLEGVRKIPIYSYYTPSPPPDAGAAGSIVFVQRSGESWEFTASGAIEHAGMRSTIEALLTTGR
ncbi:MAG: hypothetical protein Q8S33_16400 [Myxococcales bacterium]|nr:hypothetical protein [Myxococcales bacterium]